MTHLFTSARKTNLLGRILFTCPVCNKRNTDIVVEGFYHNDHTINGIHSSCEQELREVYHPMNELKETDALAYDPYFIEDSKRRGITDLKKIINRGYKIEELLNNLNVHSNSDYIPNKEFMDAPKNFH